MIRTFVAVEIDKDILDKIVGVQKKIDQRYVDIRLVQPRNMHITLKFLGDLTEEKIIEVSKKLGDVAKRHKKIKTVVGHVGTFGWDTKKYVRVIWLDLMEKENNFKKLQRDVADTLDYIRQEDYTEPKPHITLGRVSFVKDIEKLARNLKELEDVVVGDFLVKEIKLMSSTLTSNGPVYKEIKSFGLA